MPTRKVPQSTIRARPAPRSMLQRSTQVSSARLHELDPSWTSIVRGVMKGEHYEHGQEVQRKATRARSWINERVDWTHSASHLRFFSLLVTLLVADAVRERHFPAVGYLPLKVFCLPVQQSQDRGCHDATDHCPHTDLLRFTWKTSHKNRHKSCPLMAFGFDVNMHRVQRLKSKAFKTYTSMLN